MDSIAERITQRLPEDGFAKGFDVVHLKRQVCYIMSDFDGTAFMKLADFNFRSTAWGLKKYKFRAASRRTPSRIPGVRGNIAVRRTSTVLSKSWTR